LFILFFVLYSKPDNLTDEEYFRDDEDDIAAPQQPEGFERMTLTFTVNNQGKKRRVE